jgi:hypothetical protein
VPPAEDLAGQLVGYDEVLAREVLDAIVHELHGPEDEQDVERLQSWLARASADSEVARSTVEWKAGFARRERLRTLGLELAQRLRA